MSAAGGDPSLVRHFLAALAYRFHKAVAGAPDAFAALDMGHGVRTPLALVFHINGVLGYGRALLTGEVDDDYWYEHPQLDWAGEVAAVHETLQAMDAVLTGSRTVEQARLERLLQGPLSDAMTHVGQLALLRRVAGTPLPAENFYLADVQAGRVGPDQPDPVSPDEP